MATTRRRALAAVRYARALRQRTPVTARRPAIARGRGLSRAARLPLPLALLQASQFLRKRFPCQEQPGLDGALGHVEEPRDLAHVVLLDGRKDDRDPELCRQPVDRFPEMRRAIPRDGVLLHRRERRRRHRLFARRAPPIGSPSIDRQAPGHAHQPRAESLAIPQLAEAAVGPYERFLRDVFGVLPVVEHAVGDAERQRRRLVQPRLEFSVKPRVDAHEAFEAVRPLIHSGSTSKTALIKTWFSGQLPATSYQWPAASYQWPAASRQPPLDAGFD